ncbi:hypothetical protein Misp01_42340 [Microtetraspora sp. NBRC 13810]|uniref:hypothetical protein n=1 Tax=Microtetraspora sp. NBRC 13810 TaxID=3030990 RepID=UPI0024A301BE|nr:hypothetical protein [Microtetraspora sp. NBRC 13810]GLW09105.1 hypothetical protein Misp01_42340 [Microtetraspora sp. NBRC 13810]
MEPERGPQREARWTLAGVLAALFAAMLLYRVLHEGHLEQTALFYVGLPAVIAVTVALTVRPRGTTGMIMASMTVALALAGPLLGEGIVCLVMAAPLFYLVGAFVGVFIDHDRRRGSGPGGKGQISLLVAPLIVAAALEGTVASLPRDNEVTVSRAIGSAADVERALAAEPRFGPFDSAFLRLGFPLPLRSEGTGLDLGDTRTITFTPRRSLGIGAPLEPRSMTLRVSERSPGRVVFAVVEDTTLARWLDLRQAVFDWRGGRLEVTLGYRRTFDPGWYFGPLQRYAAAEAAGYLGRTFVP